MTESELCKSTTEYRLLELCGNVLDGYQKRLEEYAREVDNQNVPVSWPNYQIDRDSLYNSIMSLQLLLGLDCLPKTSPVPKTLEVALQNLGVNEEQITTEIKRCEDYLQRAHNLKESSLDYFDRERSATYYFLQGKKKKGEPLTSEEKEHLDRICEVLSANH